MKAFRMTILAMACLASFVAAAPARAVLVSANDTVFGMNSITIDTATGLEWLDVNKSTNWSYNDIVNEFGAGGAFEGWRHATQAETATLLSSTAYPVGHSAMPGDAGILGLIAMLGQTDSTIELLDMTFRHVILGVNFSPEPVSSRSTVLRYHSEPTIGVDESMVFQGFSSIGKQQFFPSWGHWLVRGEALAVPEPSALLLFGLGLAGLGLARRRSRALVR